MSAAVTPWDMGRLKSFHPEMRISAGAPVADVLASLKAGLEGAKFKIKKSDDDGFTARYTDWLSLASATINWTSVEVEAVPGADGTEVLVRGGYEGTDRTGRKRAAEGLSVAVGDLGARGVSVTTTPWAAPQD
ncbi:hypothetical protein H5V45_13615 [Nocardioides sp. KIGAM211]|uniref:Uncharacterized protein n=1 Tax=Nocardioides luti TaxID=2761101 RepID=A0A7X0RHE3_9ACTN|nr:hypothetical protein [Nocardioides luti]MBB6628359.1 hypothetical protein [Nocardioides luti]